MKTALAGLERGLAALLIGAVQLYKRLISSWLPPRCRFHPTCSTYALQALHRHGPWTGSRLTLCRLLRCHPLNPGGVDPVPDRLDRP
ncbi:MAG TPA: membrane protein insertion efficiency factor YidD [Nevskiaceae bacterium]|nr:membrane protein insertion efficiency factor YidD [Nevskiaceae bacterium]